MKRWIALALLMLLLPLPGAFCFAEETELPVLYKGRTSVAGRLFSTVGDTDGIDQIGTIPEKTQVVIHELTPTFALVTDRKRNQTGYIKRVCLVDTEPVDPSTTPPYGVVFNRYITAVKAADAPVLSAVDGGQTLITLHEGARLSVIGFESGYAKVIYHRQYGYIDSNLLCDPASVYCLAEDAGIDAPIAAYTSFYNIADTESNRNRMVNIAVACEKLCRITLKNGENLNFNRDIGPYRASNGYLPATVLIDGKSQQGYGGGTCQVSSTLYNVVLQLPGAFVLQRRAHGANGASYLPIGVDAAVGNEKLNFRFRNDYPFSIRIDAHAQDGALTIAIYKAE